MSKVKNEVPAYQADEILLLSEEILSQVSAYGVCLYLQQSNCSQTDKNNDIILHEFFLRAGHQNAGSLFNRICKVINVNEILNQEIYEELKYLTIFRNALVHGFFRLPAEKNNEIYKRIENVLKNLKKYQIFELEASFHFWKNKSYSGHWNIQGRKDWDALAGKKDTSFEELADTARNELYSPDFVNIVPGNYERNPAWEEIVTSLEGFISSDSKKSLYVQFHPHSKKNQDKFFEIAFDFLSKREDIKLLSYAINDKGISYTSYFLITKLIDKLELVNDELEMNFPDKKRAESLIKKLDKDKKVVILVNNIHLVPYAPDHITSLMKFFKDFGVYFIGVGWEYEHLNSVFSQKLDYREDRNVIPNESEIQQLIQNHTRHRGPYKQDDDYIFLEEIINHIRNQLLEKREIKARELAKETINGHKPDIELINEALYILYPYFKYDQSGDTAVYKKDDVDEFYDFSQNQTETSSIFLTLGRRDIELDYKHKILKP